jgi:hypothetical protein
MVMLVGAGFKPALCRHTLIVRDCPGHPPSARDYSQCTRECDRSNVLDAVPHDVELRRSSFTNASVSLIC